MANKYVQMLIDDRAHTEINSAKKLLSSFTGRKFNSKDVIEEFIGRRMRFLRLGKELRNYINRFVSIAAANMHVQGIMLFGSVANESFSKYSDTDILIITDNSGISNFDDIEEIINSIEEHRKQLINLGFNLRISPLLLSCNDMLNFRPIYIDFLESGVILFERNEVLSDFLNNIRASVDYEKRIVNNNVVIKWNIKK